MHPRFAVGDVLLRRYDVYAPSVVVEGYDSTKNMLVWVQPATDVSGIGSAELYMLAPEGWQDAPQPVDHFSIKDDDEYRASLIEFHRARIAWAQRHLSRINTRLAMDELHNASCQLRSLESAA